MEYFRGDGGYKAFIVLLTSKGGQPLSNTSVADFTFALQSQYTNYECTCQPIPFFSAATLIQSNLTAFAEEFFTPARTATFIMMQWFDCGCDEGKYGLFLQNLVDQLTAQYFPNGNTTVQVTGEPILDQAVQDEIESDMLLCDGIAFPLALLIFCFTLKSLRMLVIPVLNITTSLLTSFLIMYVVAQHRNIVSFAPSLMLSTTIAMSIDYSLFLLSRFSEEVRLRRPQFDAVQMMIHSSGHTVLVSGLTLALCFAGLLLFPQDLLSSLGLSCSIAVAVAVIVNLSLTPALLFIFPKFFRNATRASRMPACLRKIKENRGRDNLLGIQEEDPNSADASGNESDEVPLMKQDESDTFTSGYAAKSLNRAGTDNTRATKSRWYRFGQFVAKYPLIVLLVSLGIVAYPTYVGVRFKWSLTSLDYAPRGTSGREALAHMNDVFGSGK
jgi:uncharacterized membrane protein YdfJ with MMPL/SSD domain